MVSATSLLVTLTDLAKQFVQHGFGNKETGKLKVYLYFTYLQF